MSPLPPVPPGPAAPDTDAPPEAAPALLWAVGSGPDVRRRLLQRVAASARAAQAFTTVRERDAVSEAFAPGVAVRSLYRAAASGPRRAGEAEWVRLIDLAPGAQAELPRAPRSRRREWLVLQGDVELAGLALGRLDYHAALADAAAPPDTLRAGADGARLYLRESDLPLDAARTDRERPAAWRDFGPGLRRRVLWTDGVQAALLFDAAPGAGVPGHGHGHDEECLMLAGEVFLDDTLLCTGDWQLAPAGQAHHQGVQTDVGGLIYAHGDLHLDLKPQPAP